MNIFEVTPGFKIDSNENPSPISMGKDFIIEFIQYKSICYEKYNDAFDSYNAFADKQCF